MMLPKNRHGLTKFSSAERCDMIVSDAEYA